MGKFYLLTVPHIFISCVLNIFSVKDNSTKIRDLQTKIISLRLEIPTVYAKFLKKDYACFIQNLVNIYLIIIVFL